MLFALYSMLFALYIGVRLANFQFTIGTKNPSTLEQIQVQFSLYSAAPSRQNIWEKTVSINFGGIT
jgi:hypothetical protein